MARSRGGYRGRRYDNRRPRPSHDTKRVAMLNLNRISSFRYGIREIMTHYEVNEAMASSIVATVIAKGSRHSIASARSYVKEQKEAGNCPREATDEIIALLDKYSKYR